VVYDTGAPSSVFATSVQASLGPPPYTVTMAGKSLKVVLSFDPNLALNIPGVVGIVGSNFAYKFAVSVDYPRSRLWLDDVRDEAALLACPHVEGSPAFVDFTVSSYLYVQGHLEGTAGWFLVDTGATFGAVPNTMFDQLL